jgi:hypothetical protein
LQYIKKRKLYPIHWKELLPEAIEKALPLVEPQPQKANNETDITFIEGEAMQSL